MGNSDLKAGYIRRSNKEAYSLLDYALVLRDPRLFIYDEHYDFRLFVTLYEENQYIHLINPSY